MVIPGEISRKVWILPLKGKKNTKIGLFTALTISQILRNLDQTAQTGINSDLLKVSNLNSDKYE